jgi:hypothetical protein
MRRFFKLPHRKWLSQEIPVKPSARCASRIKDVLSTGSAVVENLLVVLVRTYQILLLSVFCILHPTSNISFQPSEHMHTNS